MPAAGTVEVDQVAGDGGVGAVGVADRHVPVELDGEQHAGVEPRGHRDGGLVGGGGVAGAPDDEDRWRARRRRPAIGSRVPSGQNAQGSSSLARIAPEARATPPRAPADSVLPLVVARRVRCRRGTTRWRTARRSTRRVNEPARSAMPDRSPSRPLATAPRGAARLLVVGRPERRVGELRRARRRRRAPSRPRSAAPARRSRRPARRVGAAGRRGRPRTPRRSRRTSARRRRPASTEPPAPPDACGAHHAVEHQGPHRLGVPLRPELPEQGAVGDARRS